MIEVKRNWLFVVGSAVFVMTLSAFTTGCRFGNKIESEAPQQDPVEGWYQSEPEFLTICSSIYASKPGTAEEACKDLDTHSIPSLINGLATSVVGLIWEPTYYGNALLVASDKRTFLQVQIDDNKRISTHPDIGGALKLMDEDTCLAIYPVTVNGSIDQSGGGKKVGEFMTRGRVALQFEANFMLTPECEPLLPAMVSCYSDVTRCGGTSEATNVRRQTELHWIFGPFVDAGVMSYEQIPMVNRLFYTVSYK